MKKVLITLMAMALVMGFAMTAAAADESAACLNCKCPLWNINCGITLGQGDPCCTYFDWDMIGEYPNEHDLVGWACLGNADLSKLGIDLPSHYKTNGDGSAMSGILGRNCRLIFDVCECEDPEDFLEDGNTVGFRFTITQGNGVYFMGDEIFVKTFTDLKLACSDEYPRYMKNPQYFNCGDLLLYLTTPGSTGSAVTCDKLLTKGEFRTSRMSANPRPPRRRESSRSARPRICTATDNGYVISRCQGIM